MSNGDNLLNYVDYDFDNLVDQLIQRLNQDSEAWKDTYRSATGQMLIELFSYVGNLVLYYIERRAEEGYIGTAKHKSSVINLVRLLNYLPKRKASATGVLKFSVAVPATKNIYIPKWTECQTGGDVKFVTLEDVVILVGSSFVTASAVQGIKVEIEFTGDGTANQIFHIDNVNVENTHLYVFVDGDEWTRVDSFIASEAASQHYRLRTELDGTVSIIFGDGTRGKAPESGKEILVTFVQSDGLSGNIYSTAQITTVNSTLYDEDSDIVENVEVTNEDTFLGGDDEEDIEEIRFEAPRVFSTGDRAVTKADYIALLENYAGVANANVWGEAEENPPQYDLFNRVKLVVLLQEWALPGSTFKDALTDYLYEKAQLTVKYEYIDAQILDVIPVLDVKANRGYTLSTVTTNIETALNAQFELGVTTKLGTAIRLSDLVHAVDDLPGVSYHHMTLEIRRTLETPFDSTYTWGEVVYGTPILPTSVRLFIGGTQVAIDDGSGSVGGFIDQSSDYTIVGQVDYTTGYIGVNISPTPTDPVTVRYQQDQNGDIVVTGQQICRLIDVDIVDISYAT